MKQAKQRVIAIDYFRGIFILMVVINHAIPFSLPLAYITGAERLWTSAAEMFMMLSGITLWIVRSDAIKTNFINTARKTWRRAFLTYLTYLATVFASIALIAFFAAHHMQNTVPGVALPHSPVKVFLGVIELKYGIGWAAFLAYYSVFLAFSPLALYVMKTRAWLSLPLASLAIFILNWALISPANPVSSFALWQVYFVLGLTIGRLRLPIIGWIYGLRHKTHKFFYRTALWAAASILALNILLDFDLYSPIYRLAASGWMPVKVQQAYARLLDHKSTFDYLLLDWRNGLLRPLFSLLILGVIYLLFQRHKDWLLSRTGSLIITMGKNTLWIFVAQAIIIPVLAVISLRHNTAIDNTLLTASLLASMWAICQRREALAAMKSYCAELKLSYKTAKYAAVYSRQSSD